MMAASSAHWQGVIRDRGLGQRANLIPLVGFKFSEKAKHAFAAPAKIGEAEPSNVTFLANAVITWALPHNDSA